MKRRLAAAALCLALPAAGAQADAGHPLVQTDKGPVTGFRLGDGDAVFRGIPFAAPPVGPLRWRAPQPAAAWTAPRPAVDNPPSCAQSEFAPWNKADAARGREDCLYLSVRTPNLTPEKKLPVMVWLHGGGNRAGSGTNVVIDNSGSGPIAPESLVHKGIVLVGFNYRLAALGFLSHPALTRESPSHGSGNYALMDQQAALRWVQRNIARFGGDPANVTVFGLSAGAKDINLQLLAPGAKGLFAKAIAESGAPAGGVATRSLADNEAVGEMMMAKAGAPHARDAATLRALPVAALLEADHDIPAPGIPDRDHIWSSASDGVVLPGSLAGLVKAAANPAPLIIGTNDSEYATGDAKADAMATIALRYGANAAQAQALYKGLPKDKLATQLSTDLYFKCPSRIFARSRARAGHSVWVYNWNHASADGSPVQHTAESPYVFDATLKGAPPIQAYWVNFAITGNPNGPGLPGWKPYDIASRHVLQFEPDGRAGLKDEARGSACDLLGRF